MSGPERQPPDDSLLDDFLAGGSPVSKAWREGARDEAPPELDAAILQQAREELARPASEAPRQDRFRDRRWPFALAAVLVLSVSTVLTINQDPVARKDAMMVPAEAPPAAAIIVPEAQVAAPMPPVMPEAAPATRATAETVRQAAEAAKQKAERKAASSAQRQESAGAAMREREASAEFAPEPAAPPAAAAAPAAEADNVAPAMSSQPPAPVVEEFREQRALGAAAAKRRAQPAESMQDKLAAPRDEAVESSVAWLERIRRLLAEQREEEAKREFARWREAYPQAVVPEDLKRLGP